ncbi:adenylate/guanylate cyclase domain-containing response regulator [Leptothoe spongobia TAU-MAC 1115]|uniref:Adenylate/guanylate cyclase domain-containing response regulator n=2 Tax=Leptothoe TaxID=2651725 RepID=A0A947DJI6_9CYAN|nr:adenylate/guanylate cyclase domain-containing response regulator [Leptothoe spongobia TAU-MAC 1115]
MNLKRSTANPCTQSPEDAELTKLRIANEALQADNDDLQSLVEIVTEHSTILENALEDQNREMADYIEQVKTITAAAITVQNDTFHPNSLTTTASRSDELGNLAQVFSETVQSVKRQEQKLVEANAHLSALLEAYSRFIPPEYLTFLQRDSILDIQLGDHVSKEMAIMFSDIRSFTTLSEQMTPQENFDFVNAYLRRVSPEIRKHNGFIVKYLGDGMMAVFPDGVDDALQAGIAKVRQIRTYNQHRQTEGHPPLEVGIGLHAGHMMVGMVGESNRMQADAVSDNVNLTARLEGLTKYYGVSFLISEDVILKLNHPEKYSVRLLDRIIVKGRQEPITIYEVLDVEVETVRRLKLETLPMYQQGRHFYHDGDWSKAEACFEAVLQINPNDKTVQLYLERIQQLTQQAMLQPWNGVWAFTQK